MKNQTDLETSLAFLRLLLADLDAEQRKLDRHRAIVDATVTEIEDQMLNLGIIPNNIK